MNPELVGVSVELVPWVALPSEVILRWRDWLAGQAKWRSAFLTPTFAEAVNGVFGGVRVLVASDREGVRALMPVQLVAGSLGRLGVWEPAGATFADRVALLGRPGAAPLPIRPLLEKAKIGALLFSHLDEIDIDSFAPTSELELRLGLKICIDDTIDGLSGYERALALRDPKFHSDSLRRERRVSKDHGKIRFSYRSLDPNRDLTHLVRLKHDQYSRTGVGAPLSEQMHFDLLQRLVTADHPECSPRLSTLHCGDKLVAAHFGLRSGSVLHYWFPVYDSSYRAYSPGRILMRSILREAFAEGVRCINRGEGDTPAKREFATSEHRLFRGVVVSRGVRGQVGGLSLRAKWRLSSLRRRSNDGR